MKFRLSKKFTEAFSILLFASFGGCGGTVYRERVEETSRYFRRLEERDRFLSKDVWNVESVSIRVPVGFVPYVAENNIGNNTATNPSRQPLPLHISGLLGSWKQKLSTGQVASEKDGFLFLARTRLPDDETEDVVDLEQELIERIAIAFEITRESIEKSTKKLSFPSLPGVIDQIEYVSYEFRIHKSIEEFDGAYSGQLYIHKSRGRKIAILVLMPNEIDPDEKIKFERAISYSLETLSILE